MSPAQLRPGAVPAKSTGVAATGTLDAAGRRHRSGYGPGGLLIATGPEVDGEGEATETARPAPVAGEGAAATRRVYRRRG